MLYDPKILLNSLKISDEEKENLIKEIKEDFPNDELLFELHLFRAIQHLKKQLDQK
ncbi:MAG TPA: hypothetical protein VMV49_01180 [Candidatus Deferrimicrobium sp.]|nr:hypothetical protein [Candidatus Deferrimicrobium sp.]